jgi:hypothetical protein
MQNGRSISQTTADFVIKRVGEPCP